MNWVLFRSRYMGILRQSSRKNGWNMNRHVKTTKLKATQARTAVRLPPRAVVVPTVSSWSALPGPVRPRPLRCVLSSLGASIWAANFAYVGPFWASFAVLFDPHGLNFTLSPITWLISHESAIKTRKSRNKRNWRNRGVNHKIKPIYPQEWILKTRLILCKYGTGHLFT